MSPSNSLSARSKFSCVVMLAFALQPCRASAALPAVGSQQVPIASPAKIRIIDVELKRGSTLQGQILQGQVVNDAGSGVAEAGVELTQGQQSWQTKSDAQGWFQLPGLRGGTYRIEAAGQSQLVRAWAEGTAPPHASRGLLVAPSTDVVRGQRVLSPNTNQFFRVAKRRLANPWVVGGVIATAVTIPVAIHNADDDDPPASP